MPTLPNWIKSNLTDEQLDVVKRDSSRSVVLASAGSGKTRSLVHSIANDIAGGADPSRIVAFTFTEKAAEELAARVHLLLQTHQPSCDLSGLYVGTIHGWCLKYLQLLSDFYGFTVLDELQVVALVSRLYDHLGIGPLYDGTFPKGTAEFIRDVDVFYNEDLSFDDVPAKLRQPLSLFLAALQENRLLTFGDLIRHAIHQLGKAPLADALDSLYVDEYQDINSAQFRLITSMLSPHSRLTVVGDDLQCIYQWRGSDVSKILDFTEHFAGSKSYLLGLNHRSRPGIVATANTVAKAIARTSGNQMTAARPNSTAPAVHSLSLPGTDDEALAVAGILRQFHEKGVPWSAMAVLLRSVKGSGAPILDAMQASGIPVACSILGEGTNVIEKFVIPVFQWIQQPELEPRNAREEQERAQAANALWSGVAPWVKCSEGAFWDALYAWKDIVAAGKGEAYNVRRLLYEFMDACGVRVGMTDTSLIMGLGISSQVIRSIEEIHRRRLKGHSRRTAQGLMREVYFALEREYLTHGESAPLTDIGDKVVLGTVHQAKGLEWPVVVLPTIARMKFPVTSQPHRTLYPDNVAGDYGTTIDDERRLFYVAVTRAKERLFLLDGFRDDPGRLSQFRRDIVGASIETHGSLDAVPPSVWQLDPDGLGKPPLKPAKVGLSDILMYLECPYQYGLRRVGGIQPPVGDELGFGLGLHEMIQRRLESDSDWTADEIQKQAEVNVHLPLMSEQAEQKARESIAGRILELHNLGLFLENTQTELEVELTLSNGVVSGVVDAIRLRGDQSLLVLDWKSSVHAELFPRYELQMQFYALALRATGQAVSGAQIVDIAESARRQQLISHDVNISDNRLAALKDSLDKALASISAESFPPQPTNLSCAACDLRFICKERILA